MATSAARTKTQRSPAQRELSSGTGFDWFAPFVLIAAALVVYANSFQGDFVYDDVGHILDGSSIRPWWPITESIRAGGPRWLLVWTLSINHAIGGLDPTGYHVFNLAVHIINGLLLWSLLRSQLTRAEVCGDWSAKGEPLALMIALLWLVHPLQTQAVTYIVQRAESVMTLFFLLVLWCLVRSSRSQRPWTWKLAAVIAFWIGLGSKEVIVMVPLVALALDRIFLSSSWKQLAQQRGWVYGLMLLPFVLFAGKVRSVLTQNQASNVGFGLDSLSWWEYALSQPGVVLHYLRLVVLPYPLCIDYEWPVATSGLAIVLPGAIVLMLLLAVAWALWRMPAIGFLGLTFFLVLAPTSSVVPIGDLAVEHRMYLPLAVVLVLLVLIGYGLIERLSRHWHWSPARRTQVERYALAFPLVVLSALTIARNFDYVSPIAIWQATVAVRPQNARANHNLAIYLVKADRTDEAIDVVKESIARCEALGEPTRRHYVVLGETLARRGDWRGAQAALLQATSPTSASHRQTPAETRILADAYLSLATASDAAGNTKVAEDSFQESLRLRSDSAFGHALYGEMLNKEARYGEAAEQWEQAAALAPDIFELRRDLAVVYLRLNETDKAKQALTMALQLRPEDADVKQLLNELSSKPLGPSAP